MRKGMHVSPVTFFYLFVFGRARMCWTAVLIMNWFSTLLLPVVPHGTKKGGNKIHFVPAHDNPDPQRTYELLISSLATPMRFTRLQRSNTAYSTVKYRAIAVAIGCPVVVSKKLNAGLGLTSKQKTSPWGVILRSMPASGRSNPEASRIHRSARSSCNMNGLKSESWPSRAAYL